MIRRELFKLLLEFPPGGYKLGELSATLFKFCPFRLAGEPQDITFNDPA